MPFASPSGPPRGPISTAARVVFSFAVFSTVAAPLIVLLLLLLPWRRRRLWLGGAAARLIARPVLWVLGVRLEVDGGERIQRGPPAIFLINHSSSIDTFASMALWPPLGCGVGKKEVIWIPLFGPAYVLTGHLRIDRSNSASAIAAMKALVATIQNLGLSPWIAPEGTRSRDGQLAPFKKGFAHLALATGLPCVPVVIHGAYALWPTPGFRMAPGTVKIEVLPPIPTADWSADTLTDHVAEVRQVFADALERGPGEGDAG